mmetsp:Transcript_28237/g.63047  ORF Transcript_28237/g.63047 Transcript_28237/m.63047 type:complete len:259 (+) Transcript_28237:214-990(+)
MDPAAAEGPTAGVRSLDLAALQLPSARAAAAGGLVLAEKDSVDEEPLGIYAFSPAAAVGSSPLPLASSLPLVTYSGMSVTDRRLEQAMPSHAQCGTSAEREEEDGGYEADDGDGDGGEYEAGFWYAGPNMAYEEDGEKVGHASDSELSGAGGLAFGGGGGGSAGGASQAESLLPPPPFRTGEQGGGSAGGKRSRSSGDLEAYSSKAAAAMRILLAANSASDIGGLAPRGSGLAKSASMSGFYYRRSQSNGTLGAYSAP